MKKLVVLAFISFVTSIPQLHSISLAEYIAQNGMPQIDDDNDGLDFSNKNLTDLTGLQSIPNIDQITELYLNDNQLQTLPADIFNDLNNLDSLYLHNNQLTTLPADIFNGLNNLDTLSLYNNQLTTLPAGIFNGLNNLDTLSLYSNQLTTLPADIFSGLNNLQHLYLSNNQLQTLPVTTFNGLSSLQVLDLRGNSFKSDFIPTLTDMIRSIPNLKQLNGKPKTQALHEHPFVTLKQLIAERIAQNIDQYRHRLHELPSDVLDLLPLTPQQRAGIAAEKR